MSISKFLSEMNGENIDEESLTAILSDIEPELLEESLWRSESDFEFIKCPNGETVPVVRNPRDYVRNPKKSWKTTFKLIFEAFEKVKIELGGGYRRTNIRI